jgi:hypothetical protein
MNSEQLTDNSEQLTGSREQGAVNREQLAVIGGKTKKSYIPCKQQPAIFQSFNFPIFQFFN